MFGKLLQTRQNRRANRFLPAIHILLELLGIGAFQFIGGDAVAEQDIGVVHEDVRHFLNQVFAERRSCRSYRPEQITDEELHKVLAAGMNAPTAKNGQSPIIIAVQNPDEVAAVNALNAKFTPNANPYYGAPTILLVLVPRTFPLGDLDGAAVLTNLCNGAYAAGLASCWINRPQFMFETNEGREMLKRWGVEGDWRGVGSVAIGHPAAPDPEAKPRKENYCYIVK